MRWMCKTLAAALAVAAAGCGGGDDEKKPATAQETPTAGAPAEGTATPEPSAAPEEAAAVVETLGSIDGARVRFILTELRRSGPTVILNARLEPADPAADRLQVADTFDDGVFQDVEGGLTEPGDVFDGVALIDPEGRKKYLVARDETNRCVCTNGLGSAFVRAEAPVELTATLSAPPPAVTQVDLVVPRFETLRDVPLAE
jgi:hypothetical protein